MIPWVYPVLWVSTRHSFPVPSLIAASPAMLLEARCLNTSAAQCSRATGTCRHTQQQQQHNNTGPPHRHACSKTVYTNKHKLIIKWYNNDDIQKCSINLAAAGASVFHELASLISPLWSVCYGSFITVLNSQLSGIYFHIQRSNTNATLHFSIWRGLLKVYWWWWYFILLSF